MQTEDLITLEPISIPFSDTETIAKRISRPNLRSVIWILNQVIDDLENGKKVRAYSITKDKKHKISIEEQLRTINLGKCLEITDSAMVLKLVKKRKITLQNAHRERLFMIHNDEPRRIYK